MSDAGILAILGAVILVLLVLFVWLFRWNVRKQRERQPYNEDLYRETLQQPSRLTAASTDYDPQLWDRARQELIAAFDHADGRAVNTGPGSLTYWQQDPPAVTVEQLLEAARPIIDRPMLGRLEVGKAALDRLMGMAGPDASEDERAAIWGAVTPGGGGLLGVPLVLPTGDEALEPDAWRLLDTDGHVIKEGTL